MWLLRLNANVSGKLTGLSREQGDNTIKQQKNVTKYDNGPNNKVSKNVEI